MEGENAQGKTNILEAIYFLANGRSFRSAHWQNLIPWGVTEAHWQGEISHRGLVSEIRVRLSPEGKQLVFKGKPQRSWSPVGPVFRVLVFTPESTALFRTSPAARRRYFDLALSLNHPHYGDWLNRYQHLIRQRNQVLQWGQGGETLEAFDPQWVQLTRLILNARRDYLQRLVPLWSERARQLSQTLGEVSARWKGDLPEGVLSDEAELLRQLQSRRAEELRRGQTLLGPHREDLLVFLEEHPARDVASQGQHRILTIALKVAEADDYRREHEDSPVFLLDDLGSELDPHHLQQLLGLLEALHAQTLLTTAQTGLLSPLQAPTRRVVKGRLELV